MNDKAQVKPDIYEIECSQREQIATLQSQLTQSQAEVAKVNGFREELRAKFHHKSDLYSEAVSHIESCRQQLTALLARLKEAECLLERARSVYHPVVNWSEHDAWKKRRDQWLKEGAK